MNRPVLNLVLLLVLVVGGGWIIGATNLPGAWYGSLHKPPFNPPNALFPIVWTALYVLIAIAGWRTYERVGSGAVMQVWWGQLLLNFAWSPIFFTAHLMWPALGNHRGDVRADRDLHRAAMARGPDRGAAVRALCLLGRLRVGAECVAECVELR